MELTGHVSVEPTTGVVAMRGDFDLANAHELRRCLETLRPAGVIAIDMAQVTFIDSTVLGVLARFVRDGLAVSVVATNPLVTRVLTTSGMGTLLGDAESDAADGPVT